ncbi:hypothetical protein EVAR_9140_1 [Eumeta japonica]|uniref:Uncharacterized protein n=1 Tax=Eumeta variegata TaxID=151549 RepID=A0A4C1TXD7_EUMVA|nr:hypothetical protein EVAR_9140_1 [Eumeta japonica]
MRIRNIGVCVTHDSLETTDGTSYNLVRGQLGIFRLTGAVAREIRDVRELFRRPLSAGPRRRRRRAFGDRRAPAATSSG